MTSLEAVLSKPEGQRNGKRDTLAGPDSWGWLPALSLVTACGLLVVATADTRARAGLPWAEPLFWAGLLIILAPITWRMASAPTASRKERIGLLVVLGLSFYLVKLLHSPVMFTFSDEILHFRTALDVNQGQHLFQENYLLPVVTYFPGLESANDALAKLSGLTDFQAGVVLVGAARLLLVLALYLAYESISGSPRAAGLAVIVYMGNPNFLFWSAQFSYESLALPVAVMVLFIVARREATHGNLQRFGLTLLALLGIFSVVITHHVTSYALAAFLLGISVLYTLFARLYQKEARSTWGLALVALVAAVTWLAFIATLAIGYLEPIFNQALLSLINMIAGEEAGRQLFRSAAGEVAPLWERMAGFGSVLLLLIGLALGLRHAWNSFRQHALVAVMALAAVCYFAMLGFRLVPMGWEVANRASEFLFVGLALIVGIGADHLFWLKVEGWKVVANLFARYFPGNHFAVPRIARAPAERKQLLKKTSFIKSLLPMALTAAIAVIFMGGVIAGWLPKLRLPQPLMASAASRRIEPQGISAARWALAFLGPDRYLVADPSNANLMYLYGKQKIKIGSSGQIKSWLLSPQFSEDELRIMRIFGPRYLVFDRRLASWDNMQGYYFNRYPGGAIPEDQSVDPLAYTKYLSLEGVNRILDTGNINLYDIGAISSDAQNR